MHPTPLGIHQSLIISVDWVCKRKLSEFQYSNGNMYLVFSCYNVEYFVGNWANIKYLTCKLNIFQV